MGDLLRERYKMPAKVTEFNGSYYDVSIRTKSHQAVKMALKRGHLVRATKCELCGKEGKTQGHHHKGYAEENWLEIQWLCVKCHTTVDGNRIKNSRPPKTCKICGKPARRLDLCETHRTRFRRYGDPLKHRIKTSGETWILVTDAIIID